MLAEEKYLPSYSPLCRELLECFSPCAVEAGSSWTSMASVFDVVDWMINLYEDERKRHRGGTRQLVVLVFDCCKGVCQACYLIFTLASPALELTKRWPKISADRFNDHGYHRECTYLTVLVFQIRWSMLGQCASMLSTPLEQNYRNALHFRVAHDIHPPFSRFPRFSGHCTKRKGNATGKYEVNRDIGTREASVLSQKGVCRRHLIVSGIRM